MSWTDERVELLKKLWSEGLSASQVAAELGGVTRNAVIGKVHRLGLSGRAKTTTTPPRARRPKTQAPRASRPNSGTTTTVGATALKADTKPQMAPQPKAHKKQDVDAVVVPISKRASILTLTENTCKWPIGDPGDGDFHFCGHKSDAGTPYCKYHAEVAYQPSSERRRAKKAS